MRLTITGLVCLFVYLPFISMAQLPADSMDISSRLSSRYIGSIGNRSESVKEKMDLSTQKYLDGLKKQEQALQTKLRKTDPAAADRIFKGSEQEYDKLQNELKNNSANVLNGYGRYVPGIDTAMTSLKFLQQGALSNPKLAGQVTRIKSALSKVHELEDQFKKADNVEDFIKQRAEYLKQQLAGYNLGGGLQQYNQEAAYYLQTVADLKQDWQDPSRMEQRALQVLNKLKSFQDFMRKNSMISSLFNIPDNYTNSGIAGLQTRDQVQQMMQQQMTMMGPNGGQTAQQNISNAQASLTSLRDKIQQYGSGGGGIPDAKINNQHTKSFLKRLVLGTDAQNNRSTYFVPLSTAFALTCGYRLSDKSVVGIGFSYCVSWGKDIRHIQISNAGLGLRSYLDIKLKGSFYASGAAEYNYAHVFYSLGQLQSKSMWQPSGLVGISKVISLKGNFVKQTKVQLFWDPASYMQKPESQHIKIRFGYNF